MMREWNEIICKLIYRFVETNFKECDQRLKEEIFTLEFNDGEKTIIKLTTKKTISSQLNLYIIGN